MGRTKAGSVELDVRPQTSHVARTDQDTFGRDALTRYTTALTGGYYFVPSTDDLVALAPAAVDE